MKRRKRIGGRKMSDDKTDPGIAAKVKAGTEKADPYADTALGWMIKSAWTPWIIVAVALAFVGFGVWIAR